jgi:hypothetical protein
MGAISVERIGNVSQVAEMLDPVVSEVFRNLNQTSTSPDLGVIVRHPAQSKR